MKFRRILYYPSIAIAWVFEMIANAFGWLCEFFEALAWWAQIDPSMALYAEANRAAELRHRRMKAIECLDQIKPDRRVFGTCDLLQDAADWLGDDRKLFDVWGQLCCLADELMNGWIHDADAPLSLATYNKIQSLKKQIEQTIFVFPPEEVQYSAAA